MVLVYGLTLVRLLGRLLGLDCVSWASRSGPGSGPGKYELGQQECGAGGGGVDSAQPVPMAYG
jgi:hypothetical protein